MLRINNCFNLNIEKKGLITVYLGIFGKHFLNSFNDKIYNHNIS